MSRCRIMPAMLCAAISALAASGCTTLTTSCDIPAIPARLVPPQYLGRPRADMQELSFVRLRQTPTDVYQVGPGDVLLLHVPGIYPQIITSADQNMVKAEERVVFQIDSDVPPAEGVPVIVREDGTIALRSIEPIQATGLTLEQLAEVIRRAYLNSDIIKADNDRAVVNLYSRRKYRVTVIREDTGSGGSSGGGGGKGNVTINTNLKRGSGTIVELPAYENDVLHALTETGGLPGLDAENEVIILRGGAMDGLAYDQVVAQIKMCRQPCECPPIVPDPPNMMRIPLRFYSENVPKFTEEDIILDEGDVVYVPARDTDKYYTGGLLQGGENYLPRDYDLDVFQAVALNGGPLASAGSGIGAIGGGGGGGFGGGGNRGGSGAGGQACSPSNLIVLRKRPCGGEIAIRVDLKRALMDPSERILVMPGDTLILKYTPCEEICNLALRVFSINYLLGPGLQN